MRKILNLSLCYFGCLISLSAIAQSEFAIITGKNVAVVQTELGQVRGYIHKNIYTFKGIPYGRAKRFMPAEKPESWPGIRSSLTYGPTCPTNYTPVLNDEFEFPFQRNRGYNVSEDCLNLNIWTKRINGVDKKPVMVWFHGGGFASGSSQEFPSYDGENLSRTGDVVVVSINHRLNTLGFLDLSAYGEKYKYSANVGAMDMVMALAWVKENISNFGGDPNNVTIFGQSGGGTKVICLMNAPAAKGLFHKAIVQSGSLLNFLIESSVARKVTATILQELHLQPSQVDSLQKLDYNILDAAGRKAISVVQKTLKPNEMSVFGLEWGPVHDGNFLPYQPNENAAIELSKGVPLLVGSVKNEFTPFIPGSRDISMDSAKTKLQRKYGDKMSAYLDAVKKAYPQTTKPSDYIDVDFIFRPLVIAQADQKSQQGWAPVYVYLFTWQSPVLDGIFKAYHNMDLPFVFNNIHRCEEMTGGGKGAYVLADRISNAWTSFAKTGNPNHAGLQLWPKYTNDNGATMIFDDKCQVKFYHDKDLLMFGKQ